MPPISRYEYKQLLDIIEETIIHTDAETATPELVQNLAEEYDVKGANMYEVIRIEYPTYYPESFRRERELDADRLKEMPHLTKEENQN